MAKNIAVRDEGSVLYDQMSTAIAECYSVDDCKNIADRSAAFQAYFKQINDMEAIRKFLIIKIRAWRRIGEIIGEVPNINCKTRTDYLKKINKTYKDIKIGQISQALNLASMPMEFFEPAVADAKGVLDLIKKYNEHVHTLWLETEEGKRQVERDQKKIAEWEAKFCKEHNVTSYDEYEEKEAAKEEAIEHYREELWEGFEKASEEVGYTMDRRDRKKMKSVVLLMNDEMHEVLRQAAFDKKITMQAILRKGLEIWLAANGYEKIALAKAA